MNFDGQKTLKNKGQKTKIVANKNIILIFLTVFNCYFQNKIFLLHEIFIVLYLFFQSESFIYLKILIRLNLFQAQKS